MSADATYSNNDVMQYDVIKINKGGHFMTSGPDTGKFIVPYDGTYQIYTTNLNRNSGSLKLK